MSITTSDINYGTKMLTDSELGDVQREVEQELEELKLGKYKFKPQTRCRICVKDEDRELVDKLLSTALTYTHLLRIIQPLNDVRAKNQKITYDVLYQHAHVCFPKNKAAQAVYRSIIEKRAEEYGVDFVRGTTGIINAISYLEIVSAKGTETLMKEETEVSVKDGMDAVLKLHELTKESDSEEKIREIMAQLTGLIGAVQEFVPPEIVEKILKRVRQSTESDEILDAEYEDEVSEPFEPEVEDFSLEAGSSH